MSRVSAVGGLVVVAGIGTCVVVAWLMVSAVWIGLLLSFPFLFTGVQIELRERVTVAQVLCVFAWTAAVSVAFLVLTIATWGLALVISPLAVPLVVIVNRWVLATD